MSDIWTELRSESQAIRVALEEDRGLFGPLLVALRYHTAALTERQIMRIYACVNPSIEATRKTQKRVRGMLQKYLISTGVVDILSAKDAITWQTTGPIAVFPEGKFVPFTEMAKRIVSQFFVFDAAKRCYETRKLRKGPATLFYLTGKGSDFWKWSEGRREFVGYSSALMHMMEGQRDYVSGGLGLANVFVQKTSSGSEFPKHWTQLNGWTAGLSSESEVTTKRDLVCLWPALLSGDVELDFDSLKDVANMEELIELGLRRVLSRPHRVKFSSVEIW